MFKSTDKELSTKSQNQLQVEQMNLLPAIKACLNEDKHSVLGTRCKGRTPAGWEEPMANQKIYQDKVRLVDIYQSISDILWYF